MSAQRGGRRYRIVLMDTNAIIEAVRTRAWNGISGNSTVETVDTCVEEATRGDRLQRGYVEVTAQDLARMRAVHSVDKTKESALILEMPDAEGLHGGERRLYAHALAQLAQGESDWVVCSPDKAAIRVAIGLEWDERVISLEKLIDDSGAKLAEPLDIQFTERWLSRYRTEYLLERERGDL